MPNTSRALNGTNHSRVDALLSRHAVIAGKIEEAQKSPSTTDFFLRQLKKQKLALKEEIEGIREECGAASA